MDEYHAPLTSDEWKVQSKKKDTKRWCKGHVGREHVRIITFTKWPYIKDRQCRARLEDDPFYWPMDNHGFICYHEVICLVCSKCLRDTPERCPENTAHVA